MAEAKICAVDGCGKGWIARGYCSKHYQIWRKSAPIEVVKKKTPGGAPMKWIADHSKVVTDECIPWPFGRYPSGYGVLNLPNGKGTMASRYMCEVVNGKPPHKDYVAAHKCGRGADGCMNPAHLYWATRSINERDKIAHGTSNRGERNGQARISRDIAMAIRQASGHKTEIARTFGVSLPTVYDIKSGRSWAWL